MRKNLVQLELTDADWQDIDSLLTQLEAKLKPLISLQRGERRGLTRMGNQSESFCRKALYVLQQNPQLVPPSLALDDAVGDLAAIDRLRPRLSRMKQLQERAMDTDAALGHDVMQCALEIYNLLKYSGRAQGLDGLRKELGGRFLRTARAAANDAEPDPEQA